MFADVIVDIAVSEVDRIFEYSYTDLPVFKGSRVLVPFGNKTLCGFVLGVKEKSDFSPEKIKPILSVLDEVPALTNESLALTDYVKNKYFIPTASALRLFLPSEMRLGKVRDLMVKVVFITDEGRAAEPTDFKKNAQKQWELLEELKKRSFEKLSVLSEEFSRSSVSSLEKKGYVCVREEKSYRSPYEAVVASSKSVSLTPAQKDAVSSVLNTYKTVSLLHGVTGSGKTEVYLSLISSVLSSGKTAIMLVPEIALTPQMLRQLRARFQGSAAILHSGLSQGERFDEWWRIRSGEARIVIGARSAIFAPAQNVGLIVIDEEHDSSYLSEQSPRYKTLDIALFRAKYNGAKIVLGSATPSVESFLAAKNGKYNLISMPERINKRPLPEIIIADMKAEVRRGNNTIFSSFLKDELKACLDAGNQAMLFLNQRGFSKSVICTECGHVQQCDACDVALTYHAEDKSLLCHYCGAKYKMITACTECGSPYLKYNGVGTERVVSDLQKMFPSSRILRMDRDTTASKEGHFRILNAFSNHEADILVGTQMIAKGHDFPRVTLVGILDADASLHFSDFRSGERTFQLITQVAGRSGRSDMPGKVVLQTYTPENYLLNQAVNYRYDKMFEQEISVRSATGFPPFADILRVMVSSESEEAAVETTKKIYEELQEYRKGKPKDFRFISCMKAPIKRIQSRFRYQIMMRITADSEEIQSDIYKIVTKNNTKTVSAYLEINPNNLN